MLVREMIEAIVNKELKIVDLAKQYGFSDRTIQTKIKNLGFEWDSKEAKYNFVGTDRTVFDLTIEEVFKKAVASNRKITSKNNSEKIVKKEVKKASEEIASTIQNTAKNTPETTSKIISKNTSKKNGKKDSDNIDLLLAGKKAKKEYRGFYLDSDVIGIIDSVNSGVKSELVNECLRKVFKDKGLL